MRAEGQPGIDRGTEVCAVGSVISGKYEVVRVLGQGAMGVVVAARHVELDEIVAIKFIHPEMHSVPDIVSRFAREAKACARLGSEHIAKVLDVGVAPRIGPYIVMEYLEGLDLASVLRKSGALSVRRTSEFVMQVCEALALAHAAGITHRDVKPENLFLTRRGNLEIVKVLDFGISKTSLGGRAFGQVRVTETSCLMGTPLYMSPEQIRATHDVDHRSDIWSLGVVLFELLTGRTAFAGETVTQVCALVLEGSSPRLADHCSAAPAGLGTVIERCLMKDPGQRYQNAADLAHALLPFAPSRARLHAERASSVVRRDSTDLGAEPSQRLTPPGDSLGPIAVDATPSGAANVIGPRHFLASVGARRVAWMGLATALGVGIYAWAGPGAGPRREPEARVIHVPMPASRPHPSPPTVVPTESPQAASAPPTSAAAAPPADVATRARSVAPVRLRPPRRPAAKVAQVRLAGVGNILEDAIVAPTRGVAPDLPERAPDTAGPAPARPRLLDAATHVRRVE